MGLHLAVDSGYVLVVTLVVCIGSREGVLGYLKVRHSGNQVEPPPREWF